MITAIAMLAGWAAGLFVALLVLVALPGQRERTLNIIAVALVLGCGAALGLLTALVLTT